MDKSAEKRLNKIYRLSDDITESQARLLSITYSQEKSGLTSEKIRKNRIEDLETHIEKLTLKRQDEIMRHYSNVKVTRKSSPSPPPTELRVSLPPSKPLSPSPIPQPSPTPTLSSSHRSPSIPQSPPRSPHQSPPRSPHQSPPRSPHQSPPQSPPRSPYQSPSPSPRPEPMPELSLSSSGE